MALCGAEDVGDAPRDVGIVEDEVDEAGRGDVGGTKQWAGRSAVAIRSRSIEAFHDGARDVHRRAPVWAGQLQGDVRGEVAMGWVGRALDLDDDRVAPCHAVTTASRTIARTGAR
jgi:hypothetical protein